MDSYCKYSQYVKQGLDQYLLCSKSETYCKHQRLCKTKKKVVHTDGYKECSILLAEEEENMASKTKKTVSQEEIIFEEPTVEIEEENSAEPVKEQPKQKEKAIVILANANSYIVRKDGNNYKIVEENNYKIGDVVEL